MKQLCLLFVFAMVVSMAYSEEVVVTIHQVSAEGVGKEVGTITASDTDHGVIFKPQLSGLPAGLHGFHVHQNASCEPAPKEGKPSPAEAAGAHFDAAKTGKHEGPYGNGHNGDLPPLYVGDDGKATLPVLAPRLKAADLKGHALMIHAGGDNYSDQPKPLGGGGARIACGVVK